ncbi:MAG: ComF family protein [Akkermansia sp.]
MFLSWIFPHYCILCHQRSDNERAICSACLESLQRVPRPICLYCGAPVGGDHQYPDRCPDCEGKPRPFAFARSAITRTEVNMPLIYRLKFCGEIYVARACAPLLAELWEQHRLLSDIKDWVLVPIPVSAKRLRERRYNQSKELAIALCALRDDLRMLDMLKRLSSSVRSQAGLSAGQRMAHARSVYRVRDAYESGRKKAPAHILLLDDVYTTGSTVRACARMLRKLPEVKKVAVITLLRVPKP